MRMIVAALMLAACGSAVADQPVDMGTQACGTRIVASCFSPKGGCEAMLYKFVANAQHRVWFEDYYLTDPRMMPALNTAKNVHHIVVQGIVDKSQPGIKYSLLPKLYAAGISVKVDKQHAIFHNKIWLIDDMICTGSFNSTESADRSNAENMVCFVDAQELKLYEANYHLHDGHSDPYLGPHIPADAGQPE